MASEELVNRLRERATTLWQWAGKAERTTGPSATTEQWRIDGDLHDDAATEIDRLARELEATRAALRIAQTTAANLHDTIRLRDRELEEARELLRELAGDDEAGLAWDGGWRCVYCDSRARYTVLHDGECPIVRARRVLANTDTAGPQSADREERRESD